MARRRRLKQGRWQGERFRELVRVPHLRWQEELVGARREGREGGGVMWRGRIKICCEERILRRVPLRSQTLRHRSKYAPSVCRD